MRLEIDTEAQALYLRLRAGTVAESVELADMVFMDVDHQQRPIGIEFVDLDAFTVFFDQPHPVVSIPPRLTYRCVDRSKEWDVQAAVVDDAEQAAEIITLTVQFLRELFSSPAAIEAVPDRSVVVLLPHADPGSIAARVDLAGREALEGHTVVLRPMDSPAPHTSMGRRVS
jgi:uncharacterized protein YuzE